MTTNYMGYFKKTHSQLCQTDYHRSRGLSDEIADTFLLGFDPQWKPQWNPSSNVKAVPRLIIPTSLESYVARAVDKGTKAEGKIMKTPGAAHIFNTRALNMPDAPIFVTEGEIDALSIMEALKEAGVEDYAKRAIGLGSVSMVKKLIEELDFYPPIRQPILIALDKDESGQRASASLIEMLSKKGIMAYDVDIITKGKDPNDSLIQDKGNFVKRLNEVYTEAKKHSAAQFKMFDPFAKSERFDSVTVKMTEAEQSTFDSLAAEFAARQPTKQLQPYEKAEQHLKMRLPTSLSAPDKFWEKRATASDKAESEAWEISVYTDEDAEKMNSHNVEILMSRYSHSEEARKKDPKLKDVVDVVEIFNVGETLYMLAGSGDMNNVRENNAWLARCEERLAENNRNLSDTKRKHVHPDTYSAHEIVKLWNGGDPHNLNVYYSYNQVYPKTQGVLSNLRIKPEQMMTMLKAYNCDPEQVFTADIQKLHLPAFDEIFRLMEQNRGEEREVKEQD